MNRIKELRTASNMSQEALGKMMNCSFMTISRYERGEHEIDSDTICRLCEIFHCTADFLLCRSDAKQALMTDKQAAMLDAFEKASPRDQKIIKEILAAYEEKRESAVS